MALGKNERLMDEVLLTWMNE